jgi:hypothetical protein
MDNTLEKLFDTIMAKAGAQQEYSKSLCNEAKTETQKFAAAKSIGITEGLLEALKEIRKAQNV